MRSSPAVYSEIWKLRVLFAGEHEVCQDTEDEGTGNRADFHSTEGDNHAADTDNEDDGRNEEVAIFVEVNRLEHLEPAGCDEAVERNADTAHDAVRDGFEEGYQRCDAGEDDAGESCTPDADGGSVAGNGNCCN